MKNYLNLCREVLEHGAVRTDRTGTGTKSLFVRSLRFNLADGFPLLTTKKVAFNAVLGELLWFITGSTNIRPLVLNNIRIWNEWPYQKYQQSSSYQGESQEEFIDKIRHEAAFAAQHGNLGPVYGKQWRDFGGVDQLLKLQEDLKNNPNSRRHLLSAWNVPEIKEMLLPPCHVLSQFYIQDGKLSCHLYQRSADLFLGVPFNIASYSLLTMMLAATLNLEVGEFVHTMGDVHIYLNLIEQVEEQLTRTPGPLPTVVIHRQDCITKYQKEDIELKDYQPQAAIKGKVSV